MHFRFCCLSPEQHKTLKELANLIKDADCFHLIRYKSCMHGIHLILNTLQLFHSLQQVIIWTVPLRVLSAFGCLDSVLWDSFSCVSEQLILTTVSFPTSLLRGPYIYLVFTTACSPLSTLSPHWTRSDSNTPVFATTGTLESAWRKAANVRLGLVFFVCCWAFFCVCVFVLFGWCFVVFF